MTKLSESKIGYRKYPHNIKILFNNSKQSLYWLGFIAADGCLIRTKVAHGFSHKLAIGLSKKDLQHLLNFQNYISYNKAPYYNSSSNSYAMVITISKNEFDLFSTYNINERKSLTLIPPKLDVNDSIPFIIGYIDGDGSWNWCNRDNILRLGIRGTKEFLSWIKELFDKLFVATRTPSKVSISDGYGYYQIAGKRAREIMNYLNKVDIYKLPRKWSRNLKLLTIEDR